MNKVHIILCGIIVIVSMVVIGFTKRGRMPFKDGDIIYYLSNDEIYKIVMPNNEKADLVFAAPGETKDEKYSINGLNCGPDNTLVFHLVHSPKHITDFSKPLYRSTIVSFNLASHELHTIVDLGDTSVAFPLLSPDGSKLIMSAGDAKHKGFYFIIKDLKTALTTYYNQFEATNTEISWSPDGKVLAITGLDKKKEKEQMYFFDIEKKALTGWLEGGRPIFSPSGQMIAYLSPDQRTLIIVDKDGKAIHSFGGYLFKDLNAWISEENILFTIGHFGYENHIGIADLKDKKIHDIKVPTTGEINGMCYKPIKN